MLKKYDLAIKDLDSLLPTNTSLSQQATYYKGLS